MDRSRRVWNNERQMNRPADRDSAHGTAIVLYDGVCNLCSATVRFVAKRDPAGYFKFAALQSEKGRTLRRQYGGAGDVTTIVLIEGGRVLTRSDAFLRIVKHLRGPWPAVAVFRVVPRALRDGVYDFVARHRYRWFGRKDVCDLPSADLQSRFLD